MYVSMTRRVTTHDWKKSSERCAARTTKWNFERWYDSTGGAPPALADRLSARGSARGSASARSAAIGIFVKKMYSGISGAQIVFLLKTRSELFVQVSDPFEPRPDLQKSCFRQTIIIIFWMQLSIQENVSKFKKLYFSIKLLK